MNTKILSKIDEGTSEETFVAYINLKSVLQGKGQK
jgi:hypothetical protein